MKNSRISWTTHTFNPWWGCVKVSPACDRCYAERDAKRWAFKVWGKKAERRFFGDKHWNEPRKWDRQAAALGIRPRVFCASMADVFEDREDLKLHRMRLWELIRETPNLDWLLLTKRPENVLGMVPEVWARYGFPRHAWIGTTAEDDKWWARRVPALLQIPASVRFVSVEPMLGPITESLIGVDWVLVGGESGPGARLMEKEWATDLLARCREVGVAYHFKQKGDALAKEMGCASHKGGDPAEWPEELRVQQFPVFA